MSAPSRDPDQVLAELGGRLSAGYASRGAVAGARGRWRGRRRRLSGRVLALGAVVALFGTPAALATRDVLRAEEVPSAPGGRSGGAVAPDAESGQVRVASGVARGVAWSLSASACRYGRLEAVGLFLTVPGGGGGARCDADALPPAALAARRVQTYFDPVTSRTWVFGALPAVAVRAEVRTRGYDARGSRVDAVAAVATEPGSADRGIPAGLRTFVLALDGSRDVAAVTARDAGGTVVLSCRDRRCGPS